MVATVSAAADGSMRLHATKMKAIGVPVKGLLDLLGLDVADLMKMPPDRAFAPTATTCSWTRPRCCRRPRPRGRLQRVAIAGTRSPCT
jgi:hypothetical protein